MNRHLLTGVVSTLFLLNSVHLLAQSLPPPPTDPATSCANCPGGSGGDGGGTGSGDTNNQCDPGSGNSNDSGCCPDDPDCLDNSGDNDTDPNDNPDQACTDSSGSVIDNVQFNHRHFGHDYSPRRAMLPKTLTVSTGGCASCGGAVLALGNLKMPGNAELATLERVHSLRDCTYPSSLGPGVFLKDDKTLSISTDSSGNTSIVFYNPEDKVPKQFTLSGSTFVDVIYNSSKGITLYDVNGNVTTSQSAAVTAQWVGYKGKVMNFELFPLGGNQVGGRITSVLAAGGRTVKTYAYGVPVSQASTSPSSMWAKSSISDAYGHTINLTYATLSNGLVVLSSATIPGSRQVVYSYDSGGNLSNVALPNGDNTTISRVTTPNFLNITYSEATERGTHRNKTVSLSNNIAADTISSNPLVYNQSSMLIRQMNNGSGEMAYWNTSLSGTGHRYVYSGGGVMRSINNGDANATLKSWGVAAGQTGWSAIAGTGGSGSAVQAASDSYPAYENPANLKGQPASFQSRKGVLHTYAYDVCGNMTSDTVQASVTPVDGSPLLNFPLATSPHLLQYDCTGFNKPLIDVDKNGNATLMDYDSDGNLISKKTGYTSQVITTVGQNMQGLLCSVYATPPQSLGPYAGTAGAVPTSISAVPGFSSPVSGNALSFQGTLSVTTLGVRTFYFNGGYYGAQLTVDGQVIATRWYTQPQGAYNVNLTAGNHTILLYGVGGGFPTLMWSGPETVNPAGVAVIAAIDRQYLSHSSVAGETAFMSAVAPASGASSSLPASAPTATETWTYYTDPTLRDLVNTHTDPDGKVTQYAYDSNRRLTQIQETGDNGSLVTVHTYAYDSNTGDLISSTDAMGRTVTYTYDARERLVGTSYADGTSETKTYGTGVNVNLVVSQTDRNGNVTANTYDASGRRTQTTIASSSGQVVSTEQLTYVAGTPDVATCVKDGSSYAYTYDYAHRVISTTVVTAGSNTVATSSVYDANEMLFSQTDAHGCNTYYAYRPADMKLVRTVRELVPSAASTSINSSSTPGYGAVLALSRITTTNPGYVVTDYILDNQGQLTATTDPLGVAHQSVLDSMNRVVKTADAAGLPEEADSYTAYDAAGNVLGVQDPIGRITLKAYFPSERLSQLTYPDASHEAYTYYADGKLASKMDADGYTSNWYYTSCCGRLMAAADPNNNGVIYGYDGVGNTTYTAKGSGVSGVISGGLAYNLPSSQVLGETTEVYDALRRPLAKTVWAAPLGSVNPHAVPIATNTAQGVTTTYAYAFDATTQPALSGLLTGNGITFSSGQGSVVRTIAPSGESTVAIKDGVGRTVASGTLDNTSALVSETVVQYNDVSQTGPMQTTALNLHGETLASYTTSTGRVVQTVDTLGASTTFTYDSLGNLLSSTDASSVVVNRTYDHLSRLLTQSDPNIAGKVTTMTYDNAGERITSTDAVGVTTTYAYDALGRKTSDTTPQSGTQNRVIAYAYDHRGDLTTLTDANGAVTTWVYDAARRNTGKTYANGDTRSMAYDAANRLVTLTDENGDVITSAYNYLGNLVTRSYATDSSVDTYAYDAYGRKTSVTKGRYANTLTYAYDLAGRPSSEGYADGEAVNLVYDQVNRLATLSVSSAARPYSVAYGYDTRGKLSTISTGDYTSTYAYRNNGQVTSVTAAQVATPQGDVLLENYSYDLGGRLTQIAGTAANGDQAGDVYTLRADDQRLTATEESGQRWNYDYDGLKQLVNAEKTDTSASLVPPLNQTYTYDPMGNRQAYTEQGTTIAYTKNNANQYTSVVATGALPLTQSPTYDHNGNMLTNGVSNYTWDVDNQLTSVIPVSPVAGSQQVQYTYDWRGRRTAKLSFIYTGGVWGLVTTSNYKYVGWNLVEEKTVNANTAAVTTKNYVWGTDLSGDLKGAGGVGGLLSQRLFLPAATSPAVYFYAYDGNGNVRALVQANAASPAASNIVERYAYDGFGRELAGNTPAASSVNTFRFSTKQADAETGMNYYGLRYYDSNNGRWINRDKIKERGGVNLYGMVGNNLLKHFDLRGNCGEEEISHIPEDIEKIEEGLIAAEEAIQAAIAAEADVAAIAAEAGVTVPDLSNLTPDQIQEAGERLAENIAADANAATQASKYDTSITGSYSGVTNISTDATPQSMQDALISNGFNQINQSSGSNGPVTVLTNADGSSYTFYTATSTGATSAQVTDSGGNVIAKIRLGN